MKVKLNTGNEEEPLQYYELKDGSDKSNYMVWLGKFFLCATFLLIIVLGGWYALEEQKVAEMGDFIEAGVGMAENDVASEVTVGGDNYERNVLGGGYGGSCTCPSGKVYQVADLGDHCGTLACYGGVSGTCNKYRGSWSHHQVTCAPAASNGCTTIAVNAKTWGSEIRWRIKTHRNEDTGCTGINGYDNHKTKKKTCCLPDNKYHLWCEDTYGDGWHGGSISVAGVNYCSDFSRGKYRQPVFFLENGKVTSTEPTSCAAFNRHECCGKKDKRNSYKDSECVPHKNGRWPTGYAHLGFKGNECEPLAWIERNGYQSSKGQC